MNLDPDIDLKSKDLTSALKGLKGPILDPLDEAVRSKTSLRMHYEAQVAVIQSQIGDLDKVREDLGLSQRKIAQLLMVDPSSWTRWTRQGDTPPPHIWRALQWYLALREKIPGLTPQYFLGQDPKVLHQKTIDLIENERSEREEEMQKLGQHLQMLGVENQLLKKQQKWLFLALISVSFVALLGLASRFFI